MKIETIDRIAGSALRVWGAPGVAVAVVQGNDVYVQGYGIKEIGKPDAVTPDTLFGIASTTKAFTSTAIAILAEEGKMNWDDHPRKHLPNFRLSDPIADAACTIRDLCSHRTGMPRHDMLFYGPDWDYLEIVRRYGLAEPTKPFRSTYQYTNIGFIAAGLAAASAAGMPWEDIVRDRIFRPLGITGANFRTVEAEAAPNHATPHEKRNGKMRAVAWENQDRGVPAPDGCINIGASEMAKWLRLQLGGGEFEGKRIISREALAETHTPHTAVPVGKPKDVEPWTNVASYCLGWILRDYRGHAILDHGGLVQGFTTTVTLVPRANVGIAVMVNAAGVPVTSVVTQGILDLMLGLPRRNWNREYKTMLRPGPKSTRPVEAHIKGTKPSRELPAYAGTYEDAAYGPVTVSCKDGSLSLKYKALEAELKHYHFNTFVSKSQENEWGGEMDVKVTFSLDSDGNVASLAMQSPLSIVFTRTKESN